VTTFKSLKDFRVTELGEGIHARAVNGDRLTLAVVDLDPNAVLPEHRHENEQLGFVLRGSMTMRVGNEMLELHAGDTYTIPSQVEHGAAAGPDGCTACDAFAPIREDWERREHSEPAEPDWP
jgi:unsaturated pyranuronate lyase